MPMENKRLGKRPQRRLAFGRRLPAYVPYGHRKTMTFPAALGCDRIDAPCVFDGPVNAISFTAYVEQFLVPTLRSSDVVIAAKDMRSVRATLGAINRTRASPKGF